MLIGCPKTIFEKGGVKIQTQFVITTCSFASKKCENLLQMEV